VGLAEQTVWEGFRTYAQAPGTSLIGDQRAEDYIDGQRVRYRYLNEVRHIR
jgi:hypothetical protein